MADNDTRRPGAYTVEDEPDRTIPEDTILRARLVDVKEKTINWKDKRTNEAKSADLLEWWFEVTDDRVEDGLYKERKIKGECNAKLTNHPGNRFRLWAEAILGRELPVGKGVDPVDDLVGLSCDITVKHREYEKNGERRIAEELDEVMPISGTDDDVPF